MDELPFFHGLTGIQVIKAPVALGETSRSGMYRALYRGISEEQLRRLELFFESHKSERWRCQQRMLDNCYFAPDQVFPTPVEHADQRYNLALTFYVAP